MFEKNDEFIEKVIFWKMKKAVFIYNKFERSFLTIGTCCGIIILRLLGVGATLHTSGALAGALPLKYIPALCAKARECSEFARLRANETFAARA